MMSLASVQICVSRDFEGILQFSTARIKFQIKMALVEFSVIFRLGAPNPFAKLTLKSAQIGKHDIQFPANLLPILQFKQTGLFECLRLIHKWS